MDSLLASYLTSRDVDDDAPDFNPYDPIFGRKITRKITEKKSYIEKLSFSDFKSKVDWGNKFGFPEFIIDLMIYIA
jgi:hypothetical protein